MQPVKQAFKKAFNLVRVKKEVGRVFLFLGLPSADYFLICIDSSEILIIISSMEIQE